MAEMIPDVQGRIRVINIPGPGGGIDIYHTQDARVRWEIKSLFYLLTTEVGVADRIVQLYISNIGGYIMAFEPAEVQPASTARYHQWSPNEGQTVLTGGTVQNNVIPVGLRLNNQMTIETITVGLQPGDDFTEIALIVEEWIEPLV